MKNYIRLLRPKHYVKNILIFMPLFFGHQLTNTAALLNTVYAFVAFCLVASAVYIVNDLHDVEKDRQHPTKKYRPIASGAVSQQSAIIFMIVILAVAIGMLIIATRLKILRGGVVRIRLTPSLYNFKYFL